MSDYRSDIDGLRALAVLPVVLFHAGVPGLQGGFIGVDVFFVISGYLITGILIGEVQRGSLSIAQFYVRRVRRIAPALLGVFIACAVAAQFLLFPSQYIDFAKSLLASEAFASNIWFWNQNGYFQATGEVLPLLHTWSLAVEEQFYVAAPLIIAFIARREKTLRWSILCLAIISFTISCAGIELSPAGTFYLIPTRAWELFTGSVLATGWIKGPHSVRVAEPLGWAGITLILIGVLTLNEQSPFPGPLALIPCLGAAAVIQASRARATSASRVLSFPPLVAVGLMSYSLYLWHWPIIAFAHQYVGGPFTAPEKAGCVLASLFAASLSWKFIEIPTRDRGRVRSQELLLGTAGVAAVLALWASFIISQAGLPGRFSKEIQVLAAGSKDKFEVSVACGWDRIDSGCHIGKALSSSFILAGDSFAGALVPAVDYAAAGKAKGGIYNSFNACPALLGWAPRLAAFRVRRACESRNRAIFERMRDDPTVDTLVIANAWAPILKASAPAARAAIERTATYMHHLKKTLVILHGIPNPGFDVPWTLAVDRAHGRRLRSMTRPMSDSAELGLGRYDGQIDISVALCRGARCDLTFQGKPIFFDSGHLSVTASRGLVGPYLAQTRLFEFPP